VLASF